MPSKHPPLPGTLASFAESGMPVFIVCDNCGRFTTPNYQDIARKVGWRALVSEIGRRLCCTRCKHRGAHFTLNRPRGRVG